MNFQDFLVIVPDFDAVTLSGEEAHFSMVPKDRLLSLKDFNFDTIKPKIAAVMMLIYPRDGISHLVLIVRNSYKGVHSSQIAFPGGRFETEDVTYDQTALRETQEEIGVDPEKIEVLKAFTQMYIPPSNFMVYPFLGICREELLFYPDAKEVAGIIELPLSIFLSDSIVVTTAMDTSYAQAVQVPGFKIKEHFVWGATAMMLNELKVALNCAINKPRL